MAHRDKRDSDVDLDDIFDLEMMLREADPERRAQKRRDARNNPALAAALAEARAAGAPELFTPVPPPPCVRAPSPWAQEQDAKIDKADLPSAAVMPARTSSRKPATEDMLRPPATAPFSRSMWLVVKGLGAFVAVLAVYLLFLRPSAQTLPTVSQGATSASSVSSAPSPPAFTASLQTSVVPPLTTIAADVPETTPQAASSSSTGRHARPENAPSLPMPTAALVDTRPTPTATVTVAPSAPYEPPQSRPKY
jgi:hypothetical protein